MILIYIGLRRGCTVAEISDGLSLTPRTVYSTLGDLREAGLLNVRKKGRRHHYSVNYAGKVARWLEPGGVELRHLLRLLANRALALLDEDEG
jgi:DNA-binding transcriptional ArsR family regulator